MKRLLFLVFIFSAPSLIQAEEQKEGNIIQKMRDVSPSVKLDVSQKDSADSVQYLSRKVYVRRKAEGASGWLDANREREGDYSKFLSEGSKLGYVWDERFCLEGSFQFQSGGGANYGIQAVIRF